MVAESIAERKERLLALRRARELSDSNEQDATNGEADAGAEQQQEQEPDVQEMKFRNYFPRDNELQKNKHAPPVLPQFEDPVAKAPLEVNGAEDPIVSIAPKKPNWDLRRDVAKKLEKLEKRTQRAIIDLMRDEEVLRQGEAAEAMEEENM